MLIRKLKNKNTSWPLWIIVVLILLLVLYKYRFYFGEIDLNFWNGEDINYTNIQGTIEKVSRQGYSEYFLRNAEGTILLKNIPKNIDNLVGDNVIIKGETKKIANTVSFFIKSLRDFHNNLLVEDGTYTFIDDLLIFDTKETPRIIPYKEGNKIIVYYKNNPLMHISSFGCSKISTSRNCGDMIDNFELHENEYFDSYNGLVYYQIYPNKRIMFNDLFWGYYFETNDNQALLNVSSIIDIINSEYIRDHKKNILNQACEDISNIDDVKLLSKDGNILTISVKGKNLENKTLNCEIQFDLGNNWNIIKN